MDGLIFISYRRDDAAAEALNIRTELRNHFENAEVFLDVAAIGPGADWPTETHSALQRCDLVIVVIGVGWLRLQDGQGRRRIDGTDDWVRQEVATAIACEKRILPVLVGHTEPPERDALPDNIRQLADTQAVRLRSDTWDADLQALFTAIDPVPVEAVPEPPPTPPTAQLPRPSILLTSTSPRRRDLLAQVGWAEGTDYDAVSASIVPEDEAGHPGRFTLAEVRNRVETTARRKINHVVNSMHELARRGLNPAETIVIGVDTVVMCEERLLDRPLLKPLEFAGPADLDDARIRARQMLSAERGKSIQIVTGIAAAIGSDISAPEVATVVTGAKLRDYTDEDIECYLQSFEPLDKAGGFGIQEAGVALFDWIDGSYSNVVGLPLREFVELLRRDTFASHFALPPCRSTLPENGEIPVGGTELSAVCVGDINYDYVYDQLDEGFLANLRPPGKKVIGEISRGAGGTAVNFAKGASKAGFKTCFVVGVVGGDALGEEIELELDLNGIKPLLPRNPAQKTSIAVILRDRAVEDTSITLTDARQLLPDFVVDRAEGQIQQSDVFYCSGYCLTDPNRRQNALKMVRSARQTDCLVLLDVVHGMDQVFTYDELTWVLCDQTSGTPCVDVLVCELPEILSWHGLHSDGRPEIDLWEEHQTTLVEALRKHFRVAILRTSNYQHEIVVTPDRVTGPYQLDYASLEPNSKVGYGDLRTAQQISDFLSPRIVLASRSPQRQQLLHQVMYPGKIEVVVSGSKEEDKPYETPYERVKRLALEKAQMVFAGGSFSDSIEIIIGADTEIITEGANGEWDRIGHPTTVKEAKDDLRRLSGKTHRALTGVAIIGRNPDGDGLKKVADCVETQVTFAALSEQEIDEYAETNEPLNRAGAYGIQGLGALMIEKIVGSHSNVVGLPLERLCQILAEEFETPIWSLDRVSRWTLPKPIKGLS